MSVILHIGAPKCGSTALQAALSHQPVTEGAGGRFRYAVIHSDGGPAELLAGEAIGPRLRTTTLPGLSSIAQRFDRITAPAAALIKAELARLAADATVILSLESWINNPQALSRHILPLLPGTVRPVLYIRPQIEALNAGWWQWGAWSPRQLQGFIDQHSVAVDWHGQIGRFTDITGLTPEIRLIDGDIVADFAARFGLGALHGAEVNRSLPAPILRLMQRHAERLRPNAHDARLDFLLERLDLSGARAPWVIGEKRARQLIEHFRPGNEALVAGLPEPVAHAMRADPRWWDASVFAARGWEPPEPQPPDPAETDILAVELCLALMREAERDAAHAAPPPSPLRALLRRARGWLKA